jgi:hypothetical protein
VCTGHCTVQCPVHRQPRTKIQFFLCAVRWFTGQLLCAVRCALDRHCRLSGAPISRFKKRPPARSRARGSYSHRQHPLLSAPGDSLSPAGELPPPAAIVPDWAPATSPVLFPLGEQLRFLPCLSISLFLRQSPPFSIFCKFFKFL